VLMHVGDRAPRSGSGLITTIAAGAGDAVRYALEGSIFITGAALQWLRDGLHLIERAAEAGALAASVRDSAGVYFVPALTGLGAPWWDPSARGTIVGLTRGTTRAHLVRAAVEAMAYQTRDVVDAMRADASLPLTELKADGGACVMDVLMQLQADLLGVPIRRAGVSETTALGAVWLAGLAEGVWESTDDLARQWAVEREFLPGDVERADRRYREWRRAVERSLRWDRPDA
jgi:glycerol kinase